MSYATRADLAVWVGDAAAMLPSTSEQDRLLGHAERLVDTLVLAGFTVDGTGIPTDPTVAAALRDAVCAQVEMWLAMGEALDVESWGPGAHKVQSVLEVANPPGKHAPRALRALSAAGLLTGGAV